MLKLIYDTAARIDRVEDALREIEIELARDPSSKLAWYWKQNLLDREEHEEAQEALAKAPRSTPRMPTSTWRCRTRYACLVATKRRRSLQDGARARAHRLFSQLVVSTASSGKSLKACELFERRLSIPLKDQLVVGSERNGAAISRLDVRAATPSVLSRKLSRSTVATGASGTSEVWPMRTCSAARDGARHSFVT